MKNFFDNIYELFGENFWSRLQLRLSTMEQECCRTEIHLCQLITRLAHLRTLKASL